MKEKHREAVKVFRENQGILRMSAAIRLGVPEHIIYEMFGAGILVKEERGLYRLEDMQPLGYPDFIQASLLVPKGVICLYSALFFHGLTTQIPYQVYIALPKNILRPKVNYPPLDIVWLSQKPYQTGMEEHILDGIKVKIYSREKTVADCFKFRNKVELSVALQALKDY